MKYNQLGDSNLQVSELCLGTMTFGKQNSLEEAHQQLDYAIERGINFLDAAEMYPVPPRAETYGLTETYIGKWLKNQQRDRVIVATKLIGAGRSFKWVRDGANRIDRRNIEQAIDDSLTRLQTDYVDLYQIHWPDRYVPIFGLTEFNPKFERPTIAIAEQLDVFADIIKAGKVRYIGLSNETPWGIAAFCNAAKQVNLPKVVSIQNAYNLLNRIFDGGLAEASYQENVGLLAYSPLAFGFLTGKYLPDAGDPGKTRINLFPNFGQRYLNSKVTEAVAAYVELAKRHQLTPTQLAIAFVKSRWFVTSTIIGATNLTQLQSNIDSIEVELSDRIVAEINEIHDLSPNPAP